MRLPAIGDGLPANVLPLAVNEVTQVGLEAIVAAFAYGAAGVRFLLRAKPLHDIAGLSQDHRDGRRDSFRTRIFGTAALPRSRPTIRMRSAQTLARDRSRRSGRASATFKTVGEQRDLLRFALRELHRVAPAPADVIALPQGAPIGRSASMSADARCASPACRPARPARCSTIPNGPVLKFVEDACVQCGLCKSTCPEKVITLTPQIDFRPRAPARGSLRRRSRPFASAATSRSASKARSSRVAAKLEGRHWMFPAGDKRLDVIRMCADCRVIAMSEQQFDPFVGVPSAARRARPRIICASASGTTKG